MIHLALHVIVPVLVAVLVYRPRWRQASVWLLVTQVVDIDHLLADPIYDPERCSIGFHPLHTLPAIGVYLLLFLIPWLSWCAWPDKPVQDRYRVIGWVGLGLLIHMTLDAVDCVP